jgi:hypothetical protein
MVVVVVVVVVVVAVVMSTLEGRVRVDRGGGRTQTKGDEWLPNSWSIR